MSPPLLGVVEEEGRRNASMLASSTSGDGICQNRLVLKEHNYMGLSECSSVDSSTISSTCLTELRLGLPGSQSPVRDSELSLLSSAKLDEKPLFPLHPLKDENFSFVQKTVATGNKRGFDDAMCGFSKGNSEANIMLSPMRSPISGVKSGTVKDNPAMQPARMKERVSHNVIPGKPQGVNELGPKTPSNKSQVVGWPPIKSSRKNTLPITSKNTEKVDGKVGPGPGALFIKVSMVGAPYLRKVNLHTYTNYQALSSALEKMFSCFTIGQYGSHGVPGNEVSSESKLEDLLHGSGNVLTYEDKDGDWMLVGDVPWEMFIATCKKLKIMKSSDAIGLAPRAVEKCRNKK